MIRQLQLAAAAVGLAEHPDKLAGKKRSGKWPKVRDDFLRGKACAACGNKKQLNAHHRIPFHLRAELELEPSNLIALCEDGPGKASCHFLFGHCGRDWKCYNPHVEEDAKHYQGVMANAKYEE